MKNRRKKHKNVKRRADKLAATARTPKTKHKNKTSQSYKTEIFCSHTHEIHFYFYTQCVYYTCRQRELSHTHNLFFVLWGWSHVAFKANSILTKHGFFFFCLGFRHLYSSNSLMSHFDAISKPKRLTFFFTLLSMALYGISNDCMFVTALSVILCHNHLVRHRKTQSELRCCFPFLSFWFPKLTCACVFT